MDGIIAIDKPAGMSSHDVVARVRRTLKEKRVGHAGTLDPDAVGVLVLAVGQATRLLPYLPLEPKRYIARALFGAATTTEDASGEITNEADASTLTEDQLADSLRHFVGEIAQVPPMVSAVHHEGRRLYELAREGIEVERAARIVRIDSLSMTDFAPGETAEATLEITCGGGTYVRTLCKDIGAALGLPAHMKHLIRESVGPFTRTDAVALDAVSADSLLPMHDALDFPVHAVSDADAQLIARGMPIDSPEAVSDAPLALLHNGRLLALANGRDSKLFPFRVFAP